MESEGYLSLFTTLFGWHYYGVIWTVLAGSGLVLVPIFGAVLFHLVEVRSSGSLMNVDMDRALAGIEVRVVVMLVVIGVAGVPTIALDASAITYTPKATVQDPTPERASVANPLSSWGDAVQSADYDLSSVRIPLWWALVVKVSQGLKYAVLNNIDTRGEAFRTMRRIADTASITDPQLRAHVNAFYTHCYAPALAIYRDRNLEGEFMLPTPEAQLTRGPDIHWLGSNYFYTNADFYPDIQVPMLVRGMAFDAERNTEYVGTQPAGAPLCTEYWDAIRDAVFAQAVAEEKTTWLQNMSAFLPNLFDFDVSDKFKEQVVQMYLHNTPVTISATADQLISLRHAGDDFRSSPLYETAAGLGQAVSLSKTALFLDMAADAVIHALVIGQAYILMVMVILLPVGLLASGYSLSFLVQAGLLLFLVSFWSVVWGLAAWLDTVAAQALWRGQSVAGTLIFEGLDEYNKRIIHSVTTIGLYIVGPAASSWILIVAGSRAAHAISGISRASFGMSPQSLAAATSSGLSSTRRGAAQSQQKLRGK